MWGNFNLYTKEFLMTQEIYSLLFREAFERRVLSFNFLTDLGVPKMLLIVFSIVNGDNCVMSLEGSLDSAITERS